MIHEAGYDIIELFSATKGMNQNISPSKITGDYSYYIENIMPESLGEGTLRFGTSTFSNPIPDKPSDTVQNAFPFLSTTGAKQQVLYLNGFQNITPSLSNLRITASNLIRLVSVDHTLLKVDTQIQVEYRDNNEGQTTGTYEIKKITNVAGDLFEIEVDENSFADALVDFFIIAPEAFNPTYDSPTQFYIDATDDYTAALFYVGQSIKLAVNGGDPVTLVLATIDTSILDQITFTTTEPNVPVFSGVDTVVFSYQSLTPEVVRLYNSFGYIKVLDVATNALLTGGNQTISGLSVACVPRAEYFGKKLWIYNGVDPIMTWDGAILEIYEEQVKDDVLAFNRIDARNFSVSVPAGTFDMTKHAVGKSIRLIVTTNAGVVTGDLTTAVTGIVRVDDLITITTGVDLPEFTGANRVELFYFDRPPAFSFMKAAHDRLWCLGAGAVSLEYRIPDLAMRFYYTYTPYTDATGFKFFSERTKTVPSEDISAKHGIADNLEAIVNISGNLVFMGRQKSQVWKGIDPLTQGAPDYFSWSSTIPVGIYHGDLIVELPNDAQFLTPNGFVSFGTLNIARQFAATNTDNMDKLAAEYISTINSNNKYRACRSFKYNNGGFCGFKIGQNNAIVSKFNTTFFWWVVFSGDFAYSTTFLSQSNDSLYLYIGNKIYKYADGSGNSPIYYGDRDGTRFIDYVEVKYVNNIKKRYANKRYEIDCDYSSSVIINKDNQVDVYISGDLRDTFILQDKYQFPLRGDVLGTINLVKASDIGNDPNYPNEDAEGLRLDAASHPKKGRLKFVSNNFSVTIVGKLKRGPFNLKKIRLFGIVER